MQENLPVSPDTGSERSSRADVAPAIDFDIEGVMWRRIFAFALDLGVMFVILMALWFFNLITLGLLWGLIVLLWPALIVVAYATLTIGGSGSATLGMRMMRLKVSGFDGNAPNYLQGLVMSVLFCLSFALTGGLILLFALFNNHHRCLHDLLSGTVVVNANPAAAAV